MIPWPITMRVRKSWVTLLVRASSNTKSSNFGNSETPCPTSPTLSWHKHQLRNNFNCSCCMDCLLAFLTSGRSYVILPAATFAASHECETGQRILLSTRKSKWLLECCSGNLMNSTIKKWSNHVQTLKPSGFPSWCFPYNGNINVELPFA